MPTLLLDPELLRANVQSAFKFSGNKLVIVSVLSGSVSVYSCLIILKAGRVKAMVFNPVRKIMPGTLGD